MDIQALRRSLVRLLPQWEVVAGVVLALVAAQLAGPNKPPRRPSEGDADRFVLLLAKAIDTLDEGPAFVQTCLEIREVVARLSDGPPDLSTIVDHLPDEVGRVSDPASAGDVAHWRELSRRIVASTLNG